MKARPGTVGEIPSNNVNPISRHEIREAAHRANVCHLLSPRLIVRTVARPVWPRILFWPGIRNFARVQTF